MCEVQNVVSTISTNYRFDNLAQLAKYTTNSDYRPKRFHGLIIRLKFNSNILNEGRATALVFESGKAVIAGAKSTDDSWFAAEQLRKQLKKAIAHADLWNGHKFHIEEFHIRNMVGSFSIPHRVNIEAVWQHVQKHKELNIFADYNFEIFPGVRGELRTETKQRRCTFIAFRSGKVIITGVKSKQDLNTYHSELVELLSNFPQ